ncbi:Uridine-cytidine kinase 2, partial [Bonamia ostreae]
GEKTDIPIYDFVNYCRSKETRQVGPCQVLIFEGILALYDEKIRNFADIRIFVETDSDICLTRRIRRDMKERGRDLETILRQFNLFAKPSFAKFCLPTKDFAHLILPNSFRNPIAIEILGLYIRTKLEKTREQNFRN